MEQYDGVYLSFDLAIDSLKIYYDHPKNVYYALNKFLTSRDKNKEECNGGKDEDDSYR